MYATDMEDFGASLDALDSEFNLLQGFTKAMDVVGYAPDLIPLAGATQLLSETSVLALEAYAPGDVAATEALVGAIAGKVKEWAGRAVQTVKNTGSKLKSLLTGMMSKIQGIMSTVHQKASSAINYAKQTVKAHPYATIVAALTAALAVGGVIAVAVGAIPTLGVTASVGGVTQALVNAVAGIKWPFGSFSVVTSKAGSGMRLVYTALKNAPSAAKESLQSLGWGTNSLGSLSSKASGVTGMVTNSVSSLGNAFSKAATSLSNSNAGSTALKVGGGIMGALQFGWGIARVCFGLLKDVVLKAFSLLSTTMGFVSQAMFAVNTAKAAKSAAESAMNAMSDKDEGEEGGDGQKTSASSGIPAQPQHAQGENSQ